jgi:hypothetical protein
MVVAEVVVLLLLAITGHLLLAEMVALARHPVFPVVLQPMPEAVVVAHLEAEQPEPAAQVVAAMVLPLQME